MAIRSTTTSFAPSGSSNHATTRTSNQGSSSVGNPFASILNATRSRFHRSFSRGASPSSSPSPLATSSSTTTMARAASPERSNTHHLSLGPTTMDVTRRGSDGNASICTQSTIGANQQQQTPSMRRGAGGMSVHPSHSSGELRTTCSKAATSRLSGTVEAIGASCSVRKYQQPRRPSTAECVGDSGDASAILEASTSLAPSVELGAIVSKATVKRVKKGLSRPSTADAVLPSPVFSLEPPPHVIAAAVQGGCRWSSISGTSGGNAHSAVNQSTLQETSVQDRRGSGSRLSL